MIRKIYIEDHNQVLADIRDSFEVVDNWMEAEAAVVWQDVRGEMIGLVTDANLMGIPTLVMQHGLRASREYSKESGKELLAQRIMVWGPRDKERVVSSGLVEPERVVITGTTITDHLKPRERHEGINILFVPLHWDKELEENYEVAKILNKVNGINLTTKVIDGQETKYYRNVITSHRDKQDHLDVIAEILKNTDVVVSLNESLGLQLGYTSNCS